MPLAVDRSKWHFVGNCISADFAQQFSHRLGKEDLATVLEFGDISICDNILLQMLPNEVAGTKSNADTFAVNDIHRLILINVAQLKCSAVWRTDGLTNNTKTARSNSCNGIESLAIRFGKLSGTF